MSWRMLANKIHSVQLLLFFSSMNLQHAHSSCFLSYAYPLRFSQIEQASQGLSWPRNGFLTWKTASPHVIQHSHRHWFRVGIRWWWSPGNHWSFVIVCWCTQGQLAWTPAVFFCHRRQTMIEELVKCIALWLSFLTRHPELHPDEDSATAAMTIQQVSFAHYIIHGACQRKYWSSPMSTSSASFINAFCNVDYVKKRLSWKFGSSVPILKVILSNVFIQMKLIKGVITAWILLLFCSKKIDDRERIRWTSDFKAKFLFLTMSKRYFWNW